jgi:hypothetical protein
VRHLRVRALEAASPVKLRLRGTREECARAVEAVRQVLTVVDESDPYPYPDRGRSSLVRVYLEVRLEPLGGDGATGRLHADVMRPAAGELGAPIPDDPT